MDFVFKYLVRVVKILWFMFRKWKMLYFNLWGFLVKMCCYRKKIYIIKDCIYIIFVKKYMINVE